ncbi:YlxR family protein [Spelaeicoccus albus]|uniref:YlxR family protein n=1 Tax=Spelaeicoccus albus TaxID=1280376 RepID=UPI0015CE44BD|nr:YlxR family protein [Spelaeicoccus albus]
MVKAQSVRTCIGCRRRAPRQSLLRVVIKTAEAGRPDGMPVIVPDRPRSAEGRGAWLHFDERCVDQARRRSAFGRALKTSGQVDIGAVESFVKDESFAKGRDTNGTSASRMSNEQ